MLLLPCRAILSYGISAGGSRARDLRVISAARRSNRRSNRHLHHRHADARASAKGHAGEQRSRLSDVEHSAVSSSERSCVLAGKALCRGACKPFARAAPRCATIRDGIRTRFFQERSIRNLHHQRRLSRIARPKSSARRGAANRIVSVRRFDGAPLVASPEEPALSSVSGSSPRSLRQAPRAWARAFPREPRDPGLPFRRVAGKFFRLEHARSGQQKTLRSVRLGRVRVCGLLRYRLR